MESILIEEIIKQGVLFTVLAFGMVQMYRHFTKESDRLQKIIHDKDDQIRKDTKELIKSLNELTNAINSLINKKI